LTKFVDHCFFFWGAIGGLLSQTIYSILSTDTPHYYFQSFFAFTFSCDKFLWLDSITQTSSSTGPFLVWDGMYIRVLHQVPWVIYIVLVGHDIYYMQCIYHIYIMYASMFIKSFSRLTSRRHVPFNPHWFKPTALLDVFLALFFKWSLDNEAGYSPSNILNPKWSKP